jgi:glycosyltransferase involved in cell wall biosynthesis
LRACRLTLVTNPDNAEFARVRYGVAPLALPDPIPLPPEPSSAVRSDADVVFVCSFAVDEPLDLIRSVAASLPHWRVAVTGNTEVLSPAARGALCDVATLTGFLPEPVYWALLSGARCIVVLSNTPGCIPCGAYEALAVGRRPVVALDRSVTRVLGDSALYAPLETAAHSDIIDRAARTEARDPTLATRYRDAWVGRWAGVLDTLAVEDSGLRPRTEASQVTT